MFINGIYWGISLVSPFHPKLYKHDGTLTIGVCDDNDKMIYINEELDTQKLRKVLSHEITHAAMFSYGINLTIQQEEMFADFVGTFGNEIINNSDKIFYKLKQKREG